MNIDEKLINDKLSDAISKLKLEIDSKKHIQGEIKKRYENIDINEKKIKKMEEEYEKLKSDYSDSTLIGRQKKENEKLKECILFFKFENEKLIKDENSLKKEDKKLEIDLGNNFYSDYKNKELQIPEKKEELDDLKNKLAIAEKNHADYQSLVAENNKLVAKKNMISVKCDATKELIEELKNTNLRKANRINDIYTNVISFINVLKGAK